MDRERAEYEVFTSEEIPYCQYYVVMVDTWMSGWGKAENRKNKLIFCCHSSGEASIVADNAKNRAEMENIQVKNTKPRIYKDDLTQVITRDIYPKWYELNAFKKK